MTSKDAKKTEVTLWVGCRGKRARVGRKPLEAGTKKYFHLVRQDWLFAEKGTTIERDESEKEDGRARISIKGLASVLLWILRDTGLQITKQALALSLGNPEASVVG